MAKTVLEVKQLHTVLDTPAGQVQAVNTVSFSLKKGKTLALLGESGCGKSMTALSLMRLLPEPAGRIVGGKIWLQQQNLLALPEQQMRQVRGRRMAMIFQEPMTALNPVLTVGQQVAEAARLHLGLTGEALTQHCLALFKEVGMPDPQRRLQEYPHQLSGGMKQRVGIAMALAANPEILIADEPTTALDVTIQNQILALLKRLQQERGMALLLITHDLAVVERMADEVAVMYAGHIVEHTSRESLFAQPQHPYTRKLFAAIPTANQRNQLLDMIPGQVPPLTQTFTGCRFADRCAFAWEDCFKFAPKNHQTATGQVRCHLYAPNQQHRQAVIQNQQPTALNSATVKPSAQDLLTLDNVQVHFPIQRGILKRTVGRVYAVDGVSFTIQPGQTLALVGESGCGKTTLGRAIVRLEKATGGQVYFNGQDVRHLSASGVKQLRQSVQMIFQDPFGSMNPRMQVIDILAEGLQVQSKKLKSAELEAAATQLLDEVGLPASALWRYPHEFSGGQRQRIAIARALAANPQLIVCDEPTSALDVSVQAQVLNLLRQLQQKHNLAYLFISHNMAVVHYLADTVAVMYLGRIVEQGPVAEIMHQPKHPYTQALLAAAPALNKAQKMPEAAGVAQESVEPPSPSQPPKGCHFAARCPVAMPQCFEVYPHTTQISEQHQVKCHLYGKDKSQQ